MNRFDEVMAFVFESEGRGHDGTGANRFDRGGPTSYGIIQTTLDAYRKRHHLPVGPVADITRDEARAIYREDYWQTPCFDRLPQPLDLVCFDAGVNCGPRNAARWLQAALGVAVDGMIGPKTISAAIKDRDSGVLPAVVAACLDERRAHYDRLCQKDPTQRVFLRGWNARCDRLQTQIEVA